MLRVSLLGEQAITDERTGRVRRPSARAIALVAFLAWHAGSPSRKSCGILWCYTGSHERADEVLEPVRTHGSPLLAGLQPMPFHVLQSAFDALYPAGLHYDRLAQVKSRYDPDNTFHVNQNIQPASGRPLS